MKGNVHMPIYEYTCKECGTQFDTLRSMKDADKPIECKDCHSYHTTRNLSLFVAKSGGHAVAGTSGGCGGCSGGSCGSCHNN
jgi:putative FmdB family regulatory protein